ncbi:MAG TPA: phage tail protein [Cyanobacteria bacterium UBA11149]|nr:phage tail protein [Cyanobacteria bacterium UBA11367]HBE57546.1 phage tail protein [Cyanobacteria bacterium UBA11366]HBK62787.1 phage tail protein [Cyanobacteria bacterium UBA11166]HBR73274.1 phage tail protein [Cyanobacteria bacterium UBA11159]HBS67778.1 phage tail protein [Cyanobacteria bacterium UBA11153]HBW92057.1 phage tail protein [Cyanobacteria bacterium UBA11149]HCA97943.1 phage tail protein [Cyanobacteria bacterium UBA9226]
MIGLNLLSNALNESDREGRFYGVTIAEVTNNQDEEGLGRVKVKFPWLSDTDESFWARILTPMTGKEYGMYFLPEVGDEVLVAFEHGMIEFPYILGGLWNGKDKPPDTNSDGKNNKRIIKSRSGNIIRLDDTEGEEKIEIIDKSGKNSIVISTKDNNITIAADADITIQSSNGKLKLSGKGIEIDSQAEVKITASQNMDLKAGPQLNIKGNIVNIN